jgi:hypothetical protein
MQFKFRGSAHRICFRDVLFGRAINCLELSITQNNPEIACKPYEIFYNSWHPFFRELILEPTYINDILTNFPDTAPYGFEQLTYEVKRQFIFTVFYRCILGRFKQRLKEAIPFAVIIFNTIIKAVKRVIKNPQKLSQKLPYRTNRFESLVKLFKRFKRRRRG